MIKIKISLYITKITPKLIVNYTLSNAVKWVQILSYLLLSACILCDFSRMRFDSTVSSA